MAAARPVIASRCEEIGRDPAIAVMVVRAHHENLAALARLRAHEERRLAGDPLDGVRVEVGQVDASVSTTYCNTSGGTNTLKICRAG